MSTRTYVLLAVLVLVLSGGALLFYWNPEPDPLLSSIIHNPATKGLRPKPRFTPSISQAPSHPPIPAALTGSPPVEAWIPKKLDDQEKARRVAADAFLFYSNQLDAADMGNVFDLRREMVQGQYDLMQSQLDAALAKSLSDARYETVVMRMAQFVGDRDGMPIADKFLIDAWVKQRPNSAWAHHSEAWYWFKTAWQVRGDGFPADLIDVDMPKMHRYLGYARDEAHQALKLEPRDVFAWLMLMNIDKTDGRFKDVERDYRSGSSLDPASYRLPMEYEISLNPHWYGSYKKMDELAGELASKMDLNPRFWTLHGDSYEAKACARCNGYDWATGLKQYNLALGYGDDAYLLSNAGEAAIRLGRYGLAAKYFERAAVYENGVDGIRNITQLQLMQALCDPNETTLAFRAMRNEAQTYGGVTFMDYPRSSGDCNYYQAELPWGDEPVPTADGAFGYSVNNENLKAPEAQNKTVTK